MDDIFAAGALAPTALLERLAANAVEDQEGALRDQEKEYRAHWDYLAELLRQFWGLKTVLASQTERLEPQKLQSMAIYVQNFEAILNKMEIEVREAAKGPIDQEIGRLFEVITALPSAEVQEVTVDRTISPAVLLRGELLAKGALQVLKPEGVDEEV